MESAARAVFHSTTQTATGIVVGALIDSAFPEDDLDGDSYPCYKTAMMGMLEVVGQSIINSVVTANVLTQLNSLPEGGEDNQFGTALLVSSILSQPNFASKVKRLVNFAREELGLRQRLAAPDSKAPKTTQSGGFRHTNVMDA